MAREQDTNVALGASDHALRTWGPLQSTLTRREVRMKRKVLIIVENLPVPFDRRVWKEAISLSKANFEVTVLCPRGKGHELGHEEIEGVHVYRHPTPKEGNSPLGYLWEYGCALFWEMIYAWWIYLRRGFDVIQGCNPPD